MEEVIIGGFYKVLEKDYGKPKEDDSGGNFGIFLFYDHYKLVGTCFSIGTYAYR